MLGLVSARRCQVIVIAVCDTSPFTGTAMISPRAAGPATATSGSSTHPIPADAALAEMQRGAGTQFDPLVVEALATVLGSEDLSFGHGDDADFEAELAFEQRVRDYAHHGSP